jgi:hypothetical protein
MWLRYHRRNSEAQEGGSPSQPYRKQLPPAPDARPVHEEDEPRERTKRRHRRVS